MSSKTLRSQCTCSCHSNPNIMHFSPCCTPDPVELKTFEIWIGSYHLGQGYDPPTKPQKIGIVQALDFRSACYKFELQKTLESIIKQEEQGYVAEGSYYWSYDPKRMYSSWLGQYFQTEEEAQKTFR